MPHSRVNLSPKAAVADATGVALGKTRLVVPIRRLDSPDPRSSAAKLASRPDDVSQKALSPKELRALAKSNYMVRDWRGEDMERMFEAMFAREPLLEGQVRSEIPLLPGDIRAGVMLLKRVADVSMKAMKFAQRVFSGRSMEIMQRTAPSLHYSSGTLQYLDTDIRALTEMIKKLPDPPKGLAEIADFELGRSANVRTLAEEVKIRTDAAARVSSRGSTYFPITEGGRSVTQESRIPGGASYTSRGHTQQAFQIKSGGGEDLSNLTPEELMVKAREPRLTTAKMRFRGQYPEHGASLPTGPRGTSATTADAAYIRWMEVNRPDYLRQLIQEQGDLHEGLINTQLYENTRILGAGQYDEIQLFRPGSPHIRPEPVALRGFSSEDQMNATFDQLNDFGHGDISFEDMQTWARQFGAEEAIAARGLVRDVLVHGLPGPVDDVVELTSTQVDQLRRIDRILNPAEGTVSFEVMARQIEDAASSENFEFLQRQDPDNLRAIRARIAEGSGEGRITSALDDAIEMVQSNVAVDAERGIRSGSAGQRRITQEPGQGVSRSEQTGVSRSEQTGVSRSEQTGEIRALSLGQAMNRYGAGEGSSSDVIRASIRSYEAGILTRPEILDRIADLQIRPREEFIETATTSHTGGMTDPNFQHTDENLLNAERTLERWQESTAAAARAPIATDFTGLTRLQRILYADVEEAFGRSNDPGSRNAATRARTRQRMMRERENYSREDLEAVRSRMREAGHEGDMGDFNGMMDPPAAQRGDIQRASPRDLGASEQLTLHRPEGSTGTDIAAQYPAQYGGYTFDLDDLVSSGTQERLDEVLRATEALIQNHGHIGHSNSPADLRLLNRIGNVLRGTTASSAVSRSDLTSDARAALDHFENMLNYRSVRGAGAEALRAEERMNNRLQSLTFEEMDSIADLLRREGVQTGGSPLHTGPAGGSASYDEFQMILGNLRRDAQRAATGTNAPSELVTDLRDQFVDFFRTGTPGEGHERMIDTVRQMTPDQRAAVRGGFQQLSNRAHMEFEWDTLVAEIRAEGNASAATALTERAGQYEPTARAELMGIRNVVNNFIDAVADNLGESRREAMLEAIRHMSPSARNAVKDAFYDQPNRRHLEAQWDNTIEELGSER